MAGAARNSAVPPALGDGSLSLAFGNAMKLVVFGLSITSSWGNGHATLWRALLGALARRGHRTVFFEKDVAWYAQSRDLELLAGCRIVLYPELEAVRAAAVTELRDADAAIVTSYCPDGVAATDLLGECRRGRRVFYDLDTPVTLSDLSRGERPFYLGPRGLADFDLTLSFTGGAALDGLRDRLGARHVRPLYGSVDPAVHRRQDPQPQYLADLSYLGTYAADRQHRLEELLTVPARMAPERRFIIAGAQYPPAFPWAPNIFFVRHLPPAEQAAFFSSSRLTLNVTRAAMAAMGYCPSGRLFEASACGTPILSDRWQGIETFFRPGEEILLADGPEDTLASLSLSDGELATIARRARERTLTLHSADRRAEELERALDEAAAPPPETAPVGAMRGALPCGV
jgi:spore maturation protein CgeB